MIISEVVPPGEDAAVVETEEARLKVVQLRSVDLARKPVISLETVPNGIVRLVEVKDMTSIIRFARTMNPD